MDAEKAKEFVRWVWLEFCNELGIEELDGMSVQDKLESLGLIEEQVIDLGEDEGGSASVFFLVDQQESP